MEKQLEYSYISEISSISSGIYRIFKEQWNTDRKAYNKIKHIKEKIVRSKERVTHYVVSGNELRPERGVEILKEFKEYADVMIPYVFQSQELERFKEEANSLIVLISLLDHEESAWNRLK